MERQREYVGIDLHRRRSVIVRMAEDGTVLDTVRIDNDPLALAAELAKAGPEHEVAMKATLGWYWAADVLRECGAPLHLAHPLGIKAFSYQRVKKDESNAGCWPTFCAWDACPSPGSHRLRCASYERRSATDPSSSRPEPTPRRRCTAYWARRA